MVDVLKVIEKASDPDLWALFGNVSVLLNDEIGKSESGITCNAKVLFWHGIYKLIENEIDKRMKRSF